MSDPWKDIRGNIKELHEIDAEGELFFYVTEVVTEVESLLADADALQQALYDIAHGMVPPEFLSDIENETKESFQTRLATWSQKRAREALAHLKDE